VTPLGIEHATFRLVAHCLNQLRHLVPSRAAGTEENTGVMMMMMMKMMMIKITHYLMHFHSVNQ
jgi:hypothetical protein